jgi:hypothetical protein
MLTTGTYERPVRTFVHVRTCRCSDARSVSSWSMVSGKENGARDSVCATETATLSGDDDDLVLKIAELQREKWTLQERVTLLEEANAALVGDVAAKSAIIDRQLRSTLEKWPGWKSDGLYVRTYPF